MRAGPVVIGQLLQNRNRYCVPIYQRHYVWGKQKQWEPFWNDIRTKAIERLSGRQQRFSHFMGAVVLESRTFRVMQVPAFQVVDGQQRLTTFQMFLAAARDYAMTIGYAAAQERISSYLLNSSPQLMEQPEVEIYKVWPTQADRQVFVDIITIGGWIALRQRYPWYFFKVRDEVCDYKGTPRLIAAYGYFYDKIRHAVETDDLEDEFFEAPTSASGGTGEPPAPNAMPREFKLDALWQALVEEFKVVEIALEEGDDAQVIFETLNERGEPLLAADLVRNNIFQRAEAAHEHAEQLFDTYWKRFEEPSWSQDERQGRYRKPRIEFFLANYIAGKIASEVNLTTLFSEYKAFIKRQSFASITEELREIHRFGGIYDELVNRTDNSPLAQFGRRLLPWDVTTVYPLVLRLWDSNAMTVDDKAACLDSLLSFIVRRAVCGLTTKNYNKFFLSMIGHLDIHGWSRDNLVAYLVAQDSETGRLPRDDEFERWWIGNPVYRMLPASRSRSLLEELEKAKRTRFHETTELVENLTVEHVLPTEWVTNWPLADGTTPTIDQFKQAQRFSDEDDTPLGQMVRRNRLKDTIGNLTLLTQPLNSSVCNGPYLTKRGALQDHSLLVLNREITHSEAWDEAAIESRSRELFKLATSIWPVPYVDAM